MRAEFWLERWREGRTGFHRDTPMPLLLRHWPALALPRGSRVLVPLCGKTLDMPWLAEQGHRVLGVELSPLAVEQFFAGQGLAPTRSEEDTSELQSPVHLVCRLLLEKKKKKTIKQDTKYTI